LNVNSQISIGVFSLRQANISLALNFVLLWRVEPVVIECYIKRNHDHAHYPLSSRGQFDNTVVIEENVS